MNSATGKAGGDDEEYPSHQRKNIFVVYTGKEEGFEQDIVREAAYYLPEGLLTHFLTSHNMRIQE